MKSYIPPAMERIELLQTDVLTLSGGSLLDLFKPDGDQVDRISWNLTL